MKSSVFNIDPSVKSGRLGGDDDDVPTKPFGRPAHAPSPLRPAGRAPPVVDVSDSDPSSLRAQPSAAAMSPPLAKELDVEKVLEAVRAALRSRGAVGIKGLARNFKICDTDGSRKLDQSELAKCLRLCKLQLTEDEFGTLFAHVDSDGSGLVDYDEFLKAVRGRLPPLRRKLVVSVFNAIDQRPRSSGSGLKDGVLTVEDLRDCYSAKDHPEVKAGKKSESAVLAEMLNTFEGKQGNRDGNVTLEEWVAYYEELSASVDNDDYFANMVAGAWAMLFDKAKMGDAAVSRPVERRKIDAIEKRLIEAIRSRSSGSHEMRALETTFKQFDADKNGTIEFEEFQKAMERFGLATGGHESVSGCTVEVIMALFERYDPDGSGSLSYDEFIKGIFKLDAPPQSARAHGADLTAATGTSLPLPSERGDGTRPGTSFARGRGGVMGGGMNSGAGGGLAPTASAGATPRFGEGATARGAAFNRSSGIFR